MGSTPVPVVRLLPGVVVAAGSGYAVNVDGSTPPASWPAGYIPTVSDAVKVLVVDGAAHVLGPVIEGQRPGEGTISGAPSSGVVPVDTVAGTVQARYAGSAPAIGSLVFLDWQMTTPRILPGVAAVVPPPPAPVDPDAPPPPPTVDSGTLDVTASDSATWSSRGVWDGYYGTSLVQGSYGGRSYSGAWFYGDAPSQIVGRTVAGARVRLGGRLHMGSYNAPLALNLWLHTSRSRPGGDVSRISGPHVVTLTPGAGAQWVEIPAGWGQEIVNTGGGLSVAGGTYGGVHGVGDDPASGQIQLDWVR